MVPLALGVYSARLFEDTYNLKEKRVPSKEAEGTREMLCKASYEVILPPHGRG